MASLDDILTTMKNGVTGINEVSRAVQGIFTFIRGQLLFSGAAATGSFATLYTVPSGRLVSVVDIEVCNTAGAPATFYISLVPPGGSAGAANALYSAAAVAANATLQWRGLQPLVAGSVIAGYASATTVTFKIAGGVTVA